ncbi:hypothetical protein N7468_007706 [Penicillium chermesinum]|uniref:PHD finger domain protein n=1 Tax=Penicillium chermesinum TaxID=63820 RepID=A0A9W9NV99_9EURO|nr:uncharacterized protein N7468_007706 [Penicillium chermesinum]KAJ5226481.1 hypothetical protein N7468_007706 [Penicillium chermesinum]
MLIHPAMFSFNYPNEPQTPTRTPTTSALDSFTTPKLESSFFDPRVTWDTADPYASSPEFLRSPQKFGLGTPSNPLRKDSLDARLEPTSHGRSYEQTDTTPPPTSASRRKIPDFEPPSSVARAEHLETPSRLLGASPRMFANLQSSPDLFQLASLDPTGSPIFPQQRLFWDQEPDQAHNDPPLPSTHAFHPPKPAPDASLNAQFPQLPTIDGSMDLPEFSNGFGLTPALPTDAALFPAPFSTSPRHVALVALSYPRKERPSVEYDNRIITRRRSSKREELRRAQGPGSFSSLSEEDEEDLTPRGLRPGLTRSVTYTASTSHSNRPLSQSSGGMASTSGIRKSPSKGRASPAKTMRPTPLGRAHSIATNLPRRTQSVILRIGRDGRAKAEMQPLEEGHTGLTDPLTGMDLDGSATESEADPAEYSEYPVLPRSRSSFALFDDRPPFSGSDSGSRPPSKGSYTSVSSSHSGRVSPWAGSSRGVGNRSTYRGSPEAVKRTPKRHSSFLPSDASYTRGSVASQSLPGDDDDSGDAQHALLQVIKGRRSQGNWASTGAYGGGLSRSATFAHLRSSPPRMHSDFDIPSHHSNTSPTTVTDPDLATPHSERHNNFSNPSTGTRCICNSMDNGGHLMIQW